MVDARQTDARRIFQTPLRSEFLDGLIQVEQQRAGAIVTHHALQPEEGSHPRAARDRLHMMQAGRLLEHQIASRQFHLLRPVLVLDGQLATVILLRLGQEKRD